MKPQRVQLSRAPGSKLPEGSVKVDRSTKWGNPFHVDIFGLDLSLFLFGRTARGMWSPDEIPSDIVGTAYALHQEWMHKHKHHPIEEARSELKGKNLACWCPAGQRCHADILLDIANS